MTQPGAYLRPQHAHACPQCAGPTVRVARRWWHRVLSWWMPVKRFRCRSFACGWDGVLLGTSGRGPWRRKRVRRWPVLLASRMGTPERGAATQR